MNEKLMLISSGKGPAECERVVVRLAAIIRREAEAQQLTVTVLGETEGTQKETALSILLRISGENATQFCRRYEGTIRWMAQSPFRKNHKRKNWFAGIFLFDENNFPAWNEKDVVYQTLRSSGPGGQHVNKTESAVRATHLPSGISVTASDERSQSMNKKAATERLKNKLLAVSVDEMLRDEKSRWLSHHNLERGNAIRTIREAL